jgi:hypothetical protein
MKDLLKEFIRDDLRRRVPDRVCPTDTPERMADRLNHLEVARSFIMEAKVHLSYALWYEDQCMALKDLHFEINEKVSELQIKLNKARAASGEQEGRTWE